MQQELPILSNITKTGLPSASIKRKPDAEGAALAGCTLG